MQLQKLQFLSDTCMHLRNSDALHILRGQPGLEPIMDSLFVLAGDKPSYFSEVHNLRNAWNVTAGLWDCVTW